MIDIITLDEHGRPIEHRALKAPRSRRRAVQITLQMSIGDQIFIRSDWPPIGSTDFARRLREWSAAHNPTLVK